MVNKKILMISLASIIAISSISIGTFLLLPSERRTIIDTTAPIVEINSPIDTTYDTATQLLDISATC